MAPQRRARECTRGFVLIYTLWIIAAASIALALIAKSASRPARVGERQFATAIELQETVVLLDYVLAHAVSQERDVDPRFITYQAQNQDQSIQDRRSLVRELKEILGQIGMQLDVPDDGQPEIAVIETQGEVREADSGGLVKVREARLFNPGKGMSAISLGDSSFEVWVRPANSKPNLNSLAREPMSRYLVHLGLGEDQAARLAAVIHDWVDHDDFLSDKGAESGQYPHQRGPRNAALRSWDEVSYLDGANAQLVEFLREHFTLHGEKNQVDADYFSPDSLAALTDLARWQVDAAIENQKLPTAERVVLGDLIGEEEAARFQSLVGWEMDANILLVEVHGASVQVAAVFDALTQQTLDWYLTR